MIVLFNQITPILPPKQTDKYTDKTPGYCPPILGQHIFYLYLYLYTHSHVHCAFCVPMCCCKFSKLLEKTNKTTLNTVPYGSTSIITHLFLYGSNRYELLSQNSSPMKSQCVTVILLLTLICPFSMGISTFSLKMRVPFLNCSGSLL